MQSTTEIGAGRGLAAWFKKRPAERNRSAKLNHHLATKAASGSHRNGSGRQIGLRFRR